MQSKHKFDIKNGIFRITNNNNNIIIKLDKLY